MHEKTPKKRLLPGVLHWAGGATGGSLSIVGDIFVLNRHLSQAVARVILND
jgi:hypothetical protein